MTPEVMKECGLDSLSTSAGNILQHGEIWTAEEQRSVNASIANREGVGLMSAPTVMVLPGKNAEIMVGEYRLSATPDFSEDGSGFDIELSIEQPRNPNE